MIRRFLVAIATLSAAAAATASDAPLPVAFDLVAGTAGIARTGESGPGFGLRFSDIGGSRWSAAANFRIFGIGKDDGRPEVAQYAVQGEYALWSPAFVYRDAGGWQRSGAPRLRLYLFGRLGMADVAYPYAAKFPVYPDMATQHVFFAPGAGLRWQFNPSVSVDLSLGYEFSDYDDARYRGLATGLSLSLFP